MFVVGAMSLQIFLNLLFDKKKESHMRDLTEKFLSTLREKQKITSDDAKQIIEGKRTYYKIMKKLRKIELIKVSRDAQTKKLIISYSLDSYKRFINKYLIEEVENFMSHGL
jgi:hypothetical protein